MKEFRRAVVQLESRYQEDWLNWLSKLIDSTLTGDGGISASSPQLHANRD